MILQSLRDLAVRENLVDDPAFESKAVRWIIALDADGRFLNAYDTSTPETLPEGSKKKPKMQAKLMRIPRRLGRTVGIKSDFLVDNAKYALGLAADPAEAGDPRIQQCHAAFLDLLRSAPQDVPELQTVLTFLSDDAAREACAQNLAAKGGFASNDLFCFQVDGEPLIKIEELQAWWRTQRNEESEGSLPVQCLVCGELRIPARLHNSFQIRGASTSGIPLVSFNANAFEKYGLSGNENAPVCNECMTAYTEALRRLTRAQYETPSGLKLKPLSLVLNGDTTAVYWAEGQSELPSFLSSLNTDPRSVLELLVSPHKGSEFLLNDSSGFYCLIVTGAQGRASVRRLHAGTVGEVAQNLMHFFRAINVDRYDTAEPLPLFRLLGSMVLNGERDRLPPEAATELWLHALFGGRLSRSFLSTIVARNRAERAVSAERAALLHLYFQSLVPRKNTTPDSAVEKERTYPMSLDRESKDPPYLLGRLLAVLENLQTAAQGSNLNRTLVDRTFGAASTRPGVVFPQLMQTAQHHLSKAGRKLPGRATNLDKLLGEIIDGLNLDGFSAVLSLEQQGRFALGYYHQRQTFFRKSDQTVPQASAEPSTDSTEETIA
ncbi:type I-C CRISPR-associated protein Cas8c/Csd1 [Terriglobus tenax]|uniref:type I-C CRISPR-associated protein Cas8c/Csd1 n=1 Tax=Terriglobus tenax TaxID=1111115 RepID=UPI0021E0A0D1|nr:type I-C CRISPR-associated protein Cas8c/Csd1 [Terriglobus tenax]